MGKHMTKNCESIMKKTLLVELAPKEINMVAGGFPSFKAPGKASGTIRLLTSLTIAVSYIIASQHRNEMLKVAGGAMALQIASSFTDFIADKPFDIGTALWTGLLKTHGSVLTGIISVWIYNKFLYPMFGEEKG